MSFLTSIILGLIQGVTEFLPVSSSAHLALVKHFFRLDETPYSLLIDLCCHVGTLLALMAFFWRDLTETLRSPRSIFLYFLALIPLVPAYFFFKSLRALLSGDIFLGPCLILSGLILLAGQSLRMTRSQEWKKSPRKRDVLMIGALQSMALIPGISRSAATLSCARVLGWRVREAVRFSFLLSIPTVLGGSAIELIGHATQSQTDSWPAGPLLVATISSFLTGFFVIHRAVTYLEKGNFKPLAGYVITLGSFVTLYFACIH